jgi:hypothetical protein
MFVSMGDYFSIACLVLRKCLMYYLFIVLWFVFPVVIDPDALTLDNPQHLQEQDFGQFEQQGKCP